MQRDTDLIRELLISIAEDRRLNGQNWIAPDQRDDFGIIGKGKHSVDEVAYHLALLIEAGFVIGKTTMEMPIVSRLTWSGHEYLDNIRDQGIWHKTKERLGDLPSVSIGIVAEIAKAEIKKRLGLP